MRAACVADGSVLPGRPAAGTGVTHGFPSPRPRSGAPPGAAASASSGRKFPNSPFGLRSPRAPSSGGAWGRGRGTAALLAVLFPVLMVGVSPTSRAPFKNTHFGEEGGERTDDGGGAACTVTGCTARSQPEPHEHRDGGLLRPDGDWTATRVPGTGTEPRRRCSIR